MVRVGRERDRQGEGEANAGERPLPEIAAAAPGDRRIQVTEPEARPPTRIPVELSTSNPDDRFQAVAELSHDAIVELGASGKVLYVSSLNPGLT